MSEIEISELIKTTIYIVLGAIIGFGVDWFKDLRKQIRRGKSVRTLINSEVDKNKCLLKEFWEMVSKHENHWYNEKNEFKYIPLAYAINKVPLPAISKVAWEKNLNLIPDTYKKEELKNILNVYELFESIIRIKEHLFFAENEATKKVSRIDDQKFKSSYNVLGDMFKTQYFKEDAKNLAQKFKRSNRKFNWKQYGNI